MKNFKPLLFIGALLLLLVLVQCDKEALEPDFTIQNDLMKSSKAAKPDGETFGNNLSFPVIWSDGYNKTVNGEVMGVNYLNGEWWYVWGEDPIDPQGTIYSCAPNPSSPDLCLSGVKPGDGNSPVYKAYLQKDPGNIWQAEQIYDKLGTPRYVDWIDWGDNLESVSWTIASQVRTEIVLLEDISGTPILTQFNMRHVSGWGISEVHGMQADLDESPIYGPGTEATVYSHNARLTIQKLNVESLDEVPPPHELVWTPKLGWQGDLFNPAIFNDPVYEGDDGPSSYSAEINVKGKVMYGYTWNLRKLNQGTGYYRITFSFDAEGGLVPLNTFFREGETNIVTPTEEELLVAALAESEETGGGGVPVIDFDNNLTYVDVLITEKQRGAGGGGSGGGKSGSGDGSGDGTGGGKRGNRTR